MAGRESRPDGSGGFKDNLRKMISQSIREYLDDEDPTFVKKQVGALVARRQIVAGLEQTEASLAQAEKPGVLPMVENDKDLLDLMYLPDAQNLTKVIADSRPTDYLPRID